MGNLLPSKPLQLSVVEPSGLLYGSELALLDILQGLEPSAFQVEVVIPRHAPFADRLRRSGITCREMLRAGSWTQPRWKKMLGYLRLASHWFRQRPALIYVNQGGILRPVAGIARRLRIPILCQVQTLEDAQWVSGLKSYHNDVATFVCNSQFIAGQCQVPENRSSTIYQGYKLKGLRRSTTANTPDPIIEVGLLGRICESKGHYFVLEAARQFKESGSKRFHFRFIGDPETPEQGRRIQTLVEKYGLADWIQFRGYQRDIAAEFASIHLLAIPSKTEPFGRIFCEAAEAQIPVLLADSGGLGELARMFGAGVRFAPGNLKQFVDRLQWIAGNYAAVKNEFTISGGAMLRSLDLFGYLNTMKNLIGRAAAGVPVSAKWLGKDNQRDAKAT